MAAWYHPLHPSTLRESCLLPPFTRRNALVELDSRIATAWHHPLHPSTLRESCLLPPFTRRNALFELDSRIAMAWHTLSSKPSLARVATAWLTLSSVPSLARVPTVNRPPKSAANSLRRHPDPPRTPATALLSRRHVTLSIPLP